MAGSAPISVLPQFQGNMYDLQTKQALAQALMQKGLQGDLQNYQTAGGGFGYVPKYGAGSVIAQLGNALLGAELQNQASQGMQSLGAQQWAALTGEMPPQLQGQGGGSPSPQQVGAALGGGATAQGAGVAMGTAMSQQQPPRTAPLQPGGALNPAGLPVAVAAQEYLRDPSAYSKEFIAPFYKPAEINAQLRAAGVDPNSALGQQIAQQGLAKAINIAPLAGGPGTTYRSATNPAQVLASNPMIESGQEVLGYTPEGRPIIASMIGAEGSAQGLARANALGKAGGEVQQVYNPRTQQMELVPKTQVLGGGAGGGSLGTGRFGGGGTSGGYAASAPLGTEQAAGVEGTEQAKRGIELDREAGAVPQQRLFIRELRQTMSGFNPGNPNADWALTMKKMVNTANPFGNTFDPQKIASQEQFNKAANQLAMAQFKDLNSGGANSTLETSMKSNPNATISRLGNKGILDLLQGNVDAKERMGQEWQKWKEQNGPGSYSSFQNEWQKRYDPQVFMLPYMSKSESDKMLNAMTKNEQAQFLSKMAFALKQGWIQPQGQ